MHVPITLVALALLTAAIFVFRNRWPYLPRAVRHLSVILAILFILNSVFMTARGWATVSPVCNALLRWLAVAGYVFLLLLFARLRPRWLTSLTAIILFIPVLGSSILLPLTPLFDADARQATLIAPNLLFAKVPWNAAGLGNKGMDLTLSRVPQNLPFLLNQINTQRIYDTQCDTAATTATLNPSTHTVLIHCPPFADQPSASPHDIKVRIF